ncbi:MAG TPA: hypothetical protein VGC41_27780, partial [Kofleriaceae bacterium]
MRPPRPWLVIPVVGLFAIGIAWLVTHHVALAIAIGACGAAVAAAIRGFLGPSTVAAVAAAGGAAVGVLGALAIHATMRDAVAGAAAMFAICELARVKLPHESPLPALGSAIVAGLLDPSYVGLVAVAGVAWLRTPVRRPRGAVIVPVLGALAIAIALACALAYPNSRLWHVWIGRSIAHRE